MRPDLVGGRWPAAALAARGERQERALAVFLRSRGARLAAAFASPLDRALATAALVCRTSGLGVHSRVLSVKLLPDQEALKDGESNNFDIGTIEFSSF
ncbi:hypothetical protein E2562_013872 [Oryza meyeriana var. granulata]|uniref:Uncharacterized protein n=1 Tax=Oryza meyeriana var. granulata TaxID=110450 RepID=A0A6G1C6F0_9ORYZ|nr:hypothetical protein E2562_013872 [Oryza meyeriana var. granulata]